MTFVRDLVERTSDRKPPLNLRVDRGDHHLAVRRADTVGALLTEVLDNEAAQ